jgi:hypothetical protein
MQTDISYKEFKDLFNKVNDSFLNSGGEKIRAGRVYSNMLNSLRPDIFEMLRGHPCDPFYKNTIPSETEKFVLELWNSQ